jgi:hypothetical protein
MTDPVRRPRDEKLDRIAKSIQYLPDLSGERQPVVTFLLGAGFSRSAGIKTAGEIVSKYLKPHDLLSDAPPAAGRRK